METVIRGAAIYFVLLIALRLSGRRTVAQMTPFDLVLLLIIVFVRRRHWNLLCERMGTGLGTLLGWRATVLISDGTPDLRAFVRARVSLDDVLTTARQEQDLERMEQIKSAVLEADGKVSIIPREKG